ncbi:hypothetical protein CYMTET_47337 [Cymbomonas tetramitiformis]|uniref:DUF221-domain-containing protein n=1 Tax=Cymbomonas tetramitiformis TaxID=36881 RepID=A0AAE0EWP0_9CHLO|nr:hypothetical protein CYMTET_47337 [Cymbomonas tetramitiformis]
MVNVNTAGLDSFFWTVGLNGLSAIIAFWIFEYLRVQPGLTRKLYNPRRQVEEEEGVEHTQFSGSHANYQSWRSFVFNLTDAEMLPRCGVDAIIWLKFLKFCSRIFFMLSVFQAPFLMLIYATTTNELQEVTWESFISMSHIPERSNTLSICVIAAYIMTVYILFKLAELYKDVMDLRTQTIYDMSPGSNSFTVLVQDIPDQKGGLGIVKFDLWSYNVFHRGWWNTRWIRIREALQGIFDGISHTSNALVTQESLAMTGNATAETVEAFFHNLFPGVHLEAVMVPSLRDVEALVKERDRLVYRIEMLQSQRRWRIEGLETSSDAKFAAVSEDQGAVETSLQGSAYSNAPLDEATRRLVSLKPALMAEIRELNPKIAAARSLASNRPAHTAFVLFPSIRTAAVAPQLLNTIDSKTWRVSPAPSSIDIIWPNLSHRWWERFGRFMLMLIIFITMVLVFLVPVTFVSGLTTVETLNGMGPWVVEITSVPWIRSFLNGYLPGVAMTLALLGMPYVFRLLSGIQSPRTLSDQERASCSKFFVLLVVDVFFGNSVLQAFFKEMDLFLEDFSLSDLLSAMGASVPDSASFFISYIVARIGIALPAELLRTGKLASYWIFGPLRFTHREWREAWIPERPPYFIHLPNNLFCLLLGLVYAVVAPLVLPFIWLYFNLSVTLWHHQMVFVYVTSADTMGKNWPHIFLRIITSLLIAQLTLTGILILKESAGSIFMAILMGLTVSYYFLMASRYTESFKFMPMDLAAVLDDRYQGNEFGESAWEKYKASCQLPVTAPSCFLMRIISPAMRDNPVMRLSCCEERQKQQRTNNEAMKSVSPTKIDDRRTEFRRDGSSEAMYQSFGSYNSLVESESSDINF